MRPVLNHPDAILSRDGLHRLRLSREWEQGPKVMWVCLNPFTADATKEDATTRKIRGFSERWGYGRYVLMNLFTYRATSPRALYDSRLELSRAGNFESILQFSAGCREVVCAWGRHGKVRRQGEAFLDYAGRHRALRAKLRCLGRNADGTPRHPLMLPYTTELEEI